MSVLAPGREIWAPGTSENKAQRNFEADLTALSELLCNNNCLQAAKPSFP